MKINLAKSAGFCFGVKRAIEIAYKTLASDKNVFTLGDIVHNEDVSRKLEKAGIKTSPKLCRGQNKTFLIRAHGTGLNTINQARRLGYKIVDATCPMVKEIHKIVCSCERAGFRVIVIGDKKHAEVRGISGQLKKRAIVIENIQNIPWQRLKNIKKACVVVQSTQNLDKALKIIAILNPRIGNLKFFNTICRPTRIKQEEIKRMPKENDAIIVIGSKKSANTKRLYQIAKSINHRSYWVQSRKDVKPGWLKGVDSLGITAGASTPDEATKEVIACIKKMA